MKLPWARLRPPAARVDPPAIGRPVVEARDAGWGSPGTFFAGMAVADSVGSYIAENAAAVVGCVNAVSGALSSLPIRTYRAEPGGGRTELSVRDHWLPALLASPSPEATWPETIETMVSTAMLNGNCICTLEYNEDGEPTELSAIPWHCCTPVLLPTGRLAFNVNLQFGPFVGAGIFRRYLPGEYLLLKDRGDHKWLGRSRLGRSPAVLAAALALGEYSASVWNNSASPSGAVTHPGRLNAEAKSYLREESDKNYAGARNARRTLLLDEGLTFVPISVSPMDAETLDSRKFTVIEICRIMGVPPAVCFSMENNAFTSAEQQNRMFASMSLVPWAKKIESAIAKALLGDEPDIHVEIDFASLVRGDPSTRWASYQIALQNKVLSVAEVREAEGYSPIPSPGELEPGAGADP